MSYNMTCLALVAVVLLSIQDGTTVKAQESQVMELKKRSARFDCDGASFSSATLASYIIRHRCYTRSWSDFFHGRAVTAQVRAISDDLEEENPRDIEPPLRKVFRALWMLDLRDIKVVILGQDPTPQRGMATGLAFSLQPGVHTRDVPSVYNIMVELRLEGANVGFDNGDLSPWVTQGVLLLNAALTVRVGSAGSHARTWRQFTALLIEYISNNGRPTAWLLWGSDARSYRRFIARNRGHYILEGGHPSPVHAAYTNFLGGNYFSCVNQFLDYHNRREINWRITYREQPIRPCPRPNDYAGKRNFVVDKSWNNVATKNNLCWLNDVPQRKRGHLPYWRQQIPHLNTSDKYRYFGESLEKHRSKTGRPSSYLTGLL